MSEFAKGVVTAVIVLSLGLVLAGLLTKATDLAVEKLASELAIDPDAQACISMVKEAKLGSVIPHEGDAR